MGVFTEKYKAVGGEECFRLVHDGQIYFAGTLKLRAMGFVPRLDFLQFLSNVDGNPNWTVIEDMSHEEWEKWAEAKKWFVWCGGRYDLKIYQESSRSFNVYYSTVSKFCDEGMYGKFVLIGKFDNLDGAAVCAHEVIENKGVYEKVSVQ